MAAAEGKKQLKQIIEPRLAKAFTHPLRGHIWVTICEQGVASPREIADETGIDVSEISYHFRNLRKNELSRMAMERMGIEASRSEDVLRDFRQRYHAQIHAPRGRTGK